MGGSTKLVYCSYSEFKALNSAYVHVGTSKLWTMGLTARMTRLVLSYNWRAPPGVLKETYGPHASRSFMGKMGYPSIAVKITPTIWFVGNCCESEVRWVMSRWEEVEGGWRGGREWKISGLPSQERHMSRLPTGCIVLQWDQSKEGRAIAKTQAHQDRLSIR